MAKRKVSMASNDMMDSETGTEQVIADIKSEDSVDTFCFETDHVALKGNPDYQELLRTVAILEAQRTQAIKDLDTLLQYKQEAITDPIVFVHKLQQGLDLGLPRPQNIASIPQVDWSKYTDNVDSFSLNHKHRTRYKKYVEDTSSNVSSRSTTPTSSIFGVDPTNQGAYQQSHGGRLSDGQLQDEKSLVVIRGKMKGESKPSTFNQLWTSEEQRRLEELLMKYPPEEVEARRWEKIAKELGNRTKFQVQSRMQKYLLRLAREGLPLPGRMPHPSALQRRRLHLHHRQNRLLYPESTMCVSYRLPVYMSDDEDSNSYGMYDLDEGESSVNDSLIQVSDEEDIPVSLRNTDEYREIMNLKRQKKSQLRRAETLRHIGYSCDKCGSEPIVGTRWHCTDCPKEHSVDFCDDCSDFVFETEHHKTDHHLEPIRNVDRSGHHHDTDYTPSQFIPGDYNYLDPNYMPAS